MNKNKAEYDVWCDDDIDVLKLQGLRLLSTAQACQTGAATALKPGSLQRTAIEIKPASSLKTPSSNSRPSTSSSLVVPIFLHLCIASNFNLRLAFLCCFPLLRSRRHDTPRHEFVVPAAHLCTPAALEVEKAWLACDFRACDTTKRPPRPRQKLDLSSLRRSRQILPHHYKASVVITIASTYRRAR